MKPELIDQLCEQLDQPGYWYFEYNRTANLVREQLAELDEELAKHGPTVDLIARRDQVEMECRFLSVGAGLALPSFDVPQADR